MILLKKRFMRNNLKKKSGFSKQVCFQLRIQLENNFCRHFNDNYINDWTLDYMYRLLEFPLEIQLNIRLRGHMHYFVL